VPLQLVYSEEGVAETTHELRAMGVRFLEPEPILKLIGAALREIERELFIEQGYGSWEPLAPRTVAEKGHETILVDTHGLMDSLTDEGDGAHIEIIQRDELIFGTSDPKAGWARRGDAERNRPPRDPLQVHETDVKAFSKAVQAYLVGVDRTEFGINRGGDWADRMPKALA
jgi:hypothetical protein